MKIGEDSDYIAMCDMSEKVSCSAVISSEYSKLFSHMGLVPKDSMLDVPNAYYGVVFYSAMLVLYIFSSRIPYAKTLALLASLASAVMSVSLYYIMVYILDDICVVCMCTHACNAIVLAVAVLDFRDMSCRTPSREKFD
mmetsp:Transcript_10695/g.19863  ORF Transcript_10695/g.19863 Transcript_10695/m.19863 type:complete len:139 (+) Transcript_10695:324-740(+)